MAQSSGNIVGVSQSAMTHYQDSVQNNFDGIRAGFRAFLIEAFGLTFHGPTAGEFNQALRALADSTMEQLDGAMTQFATALSEATSALARQFGGTQINFSYRGGLEPMPTPASQESDDYRVDLDQVNAFLTEGVTAAGQSIGALIDANQEAINGVPAADSATPGWSGQTRDYIQSTLVPNQVMNLHEVLGQLLAQVTDFLTQTLANIGAADAAVTGA